MVQETPSDITTKMTAYFDSIHCIACTHLPSQFFLDKNFSISMFESPVLNSPPHIPYQAPKRGREEEDGIRKLRVQLTKTHCRGTHLPTSLKQQLPLPVEPSSLVNHNLHLCSITHSITHQQSPSRTFSHGRHQPDLHDHQLIRLSRLPRDNGRCHHNPLHNLRSFTLRYPPSFNDTMWIVSTIQKLQA